MAVYELVIEIGNSQCSIYKKDSGLVLKESTLIAFSKQGKRFIVKEVGNKAQEMLNKTSNSVWVESPIKDGVVVNSELAVLMLKAFINRVIPKSFLPPVINAVLVTSCALTSEEKRAYELLLINSGVSVVWFVPSVISSLIGGGIDVKGSKARLIVNIGAGVTEIAAVSNSTIIDGYAVEMGGNVINSAICSTIYDDQGVVISDVVAEKIKVEIGSLFERDNATIEVSGFDALTKAARNVTIYAKDLYPVIAIAYKKISDAIEIFLNAQSADVCSDIASEGIYVCGGASKVTGLEMFLKRNLMLNINVLDDAENISILGGGQLISDKEHLSVIIENN